ncbi:hypothetical protein ACFVH6_05385 [Spirillospora sp. NPDC127200]
MRRFTSLLAAAALTGGLTATLAAPAAHAVPVAAKAAARPKAGAVCPQAAAAMAELPAAKPARRAAEPAYFAMRDLHGDRFVFRLDDADKIAHARRILSGKETEQVHVMGRIKKTRASYNPGWDFHLDPGSIHFFTVAIEVCDATIRYTEDHLDEACGAFLPGCHWCPWSSRVVAEVTPRSGDRTT